MFAQPLQTTYLGQPVAMARQPVPMTTSSDWCSALFVGFSGVNSFLFPHDTLAVSGGQIVYAADDATDLQGTYQAAIQTGGPGRIDLSRACLTRSSGSSLTCDMVAAELVAFAAMKPADPGVPCTDSPAEPSSCQFYFSYQNIACAAGPDGGCGCTYDVSFAGAVKGRWGRNGTVLTHADASKMLPSQVDYCVASPGQRMTLWGHDRTSIFDQTGIRTLELQGQGTP